MSNKLPINASMLQYIDENIQSNMIYQNMRLDAVSQFNQINKNRNISQNITRTNASAHSGFNYDVDNILM